MSGPRGKTNYYDPLSTEYPPTVKVTPFFFSTRFDLMVKNSEDSHTLGGSGEGRVQVRGKWRGCKSYSPVRYTLVNRSHRNHHMLPHG